MIQGKDIIITGIQSWDIKIGSNCKNIASELSKDNRVLYVNPPLDRITKLKNKALHSSYKNNGDRSGLKKINDRLWIFYPACTLESISRLPFTKLFNWLNKQNNRRFAKEIASAKKVLGITDYIHFCDSDMFRSFYLKEMLKPNFFIYYMRDNLKENPFWKINGQHLEPQLIEKADLVVNNSMLYTEYGAKYNPHSYMVGQGCDTTVFDPRKNIIETHVALKQIPKPIIGYVGYLSARRLNVELLKTIAQQKKDWSLVLVGPEDETFEKSALHHMENVYFLGTRKEEELPSFIHGFDVAINPQHINTVTNGNYPRKIDEYLAMGKPVVASATKAMDYFKNFAYLGKTSHDYLQLIEHALTDISPEKKLNRICFATNHTWTASVNEIKKLALKVSQLNDTNL